MPDRFDIGCIIPTFNRAEMVAETIARLEKYLVYTLGSIHYYVGMDGSDNTSQVLAGKPNVVLIEGPRQGLGANLNNLIAQAPTDLLFQLDDDHQLQDYLALDEHALNLTHDPNFGWIRLYYGECLAGPVGYYNFRAELYGKYWRLDPFGRELYLPSNRPHLKHRRFHERYGLYQTGLKLGETENNFCHRYLSLRRGEIARMADGHDVMIPMYAPREGTWAHDSSHSLQKAGY